MSRILAYKCDRTGLIFEHKFEYDEHLRREALKRRRERAAAKKVQDWLNFISGVTNASSFEEIEQWFLTNGEEIIKRRINKTGLRQRGPHFIVLKFKDMRWSDQCSNIHVAPKGKPTNWWNKSDLPLGYPGWRGLVSFTLPPNNFLGAGIFEDTPIRTGTGSGGCGVYRYNVTLFAEEFLNLFTMEKMKGNIPS